MKIYGPRFYGNGGDYMFPTFDGTNVYMKWNDGSLYLMTDEGTNTTTMVRVKGKGNNPGVLEIQDGADDDLMRLYMDSDNGYITWNDGDLTLQTDEGTNTNTRLVIQPKGTAAAYLRIVTPNGYDSAVTLIETSGDAAFIGIDASANCLKINGQNDSNLNHICVKTTGLVGFGTSGPATLLHLFDDTATVGLSIQSDNASFSDINMGDEDDINIGRIRYDQSNDAMQFYANNSQRMQIDSTEIQVTLPVRPDASGTIDLGSLTYAFDDAYIDKVHLESDPTTPLQAATKQYVDAQISGENYWDRSGGEVYTENSGDNIVPNASGTQNIGTAAKAFNEGHFVSLYADDVFTAQSSLHIGGITIDEQSSALTIDRSISALTGTDNNASFYFGGARSSNQCGYLGFNNSDNLVDLHIFGQSEGDGIVVDTTGVGIGTNTPETKLEVNVSHGTPDGIVIGSESANPFAANTIGLDILSSSVRAQLITDEGSDKAVRLKATTNHDIAFHANDSEQMRVTPSGVGIGTDTLVGGANLEVYNASGNGIICIKGGSGAEARLRLDADAGSNANDEAWIRKVNDGALILANDNSASVTHLSITTDGNVGIATNSPDGILNSVDTVSARWYNDMVTADEYGPSIATRKARGTVGSEAIVQNNDSVGLFGFFGYDGSGYHRGASMRGYVDGTPSDGTDMPMRLEFYTAPDGSATEAKRMTITSDGKIGFGTDSPDKMLKIKDSVNTNTAQLKLTDSADATSSYLGQFSDSTYLTNNSTYASGWAADDNAVGVAAVVLGDGAVSFQTVAAGTAAPVTRMAIDSGGVVTITNTGSAVLVCQAGTGQSASIRLKNDAQDWDLNTQTTDTFAIYDQTNGKQPFTIEPNTPTDTLYLDTAGSVKVGFGILPAASGTIDIGSVAYAFDDAYIDKLYLEGDPTTGFQATTKDYVDSLVQGLDWQPSVIARRGAPLPAPGNGDRYIATATASGWTDTYIYEWQTNTWEETVSDEGMATWVEDEDKQYTFNGVSWITFGSTSVHNNMSGLQGGTADEYYHLTSTEYGGNWGSKNLTTTGTATADQLIASSNSDTTTLSHDGTDASLIWSDGSLKLITDEGTNTQSTVEIIGKGSGNAALYIQDGAGANGRMTMTVGASNVELDFGSNVTEYVINQAGADVDIRMESNGQASMFKIDAGNDQAEFNSSKATDGVVQITNAVNTSDVNHGILNLQNDANYAVGNDARIMFSAHESGESMHPLASMGLVVEGSYQGALQFNTRSASGTYAEKMRITSAGNVGIGTNDPQTTFGGLDIASGGVTFIVGADSNASTRTNSTDKHMRMGIPHYTNAEEPMALCYAKSDSTTNVLNFGGATVAFNAATEVNIYTAANNTTVTGTKRATIDEDGLTVVGDAEIVSTGAFYIGDPDTNGSWRFTIDGANLVFEKRESGSWVTKSTVVA